MRWWHWLCGHQLKPFVQHTNKLASETMRFLEAHRYDRGTTCSCGKLWWKR